MNQSHQSPRSASPSPPERPEAQQNSLPDQDALGNAGVLEQLGDELEQGNAQPAEAGQAAAPSAPADDGADEAGPAGPEPAFEEASQQEADVDVGGEGAAVDGGAPAVAPTVAPPAPAAADAVPDAVSAPEPAVPASGADSCDEYLNACVSNDRCDALQADERDWIDTVNAVRGHPMAEAVINVGERLIPFYGAWDAVRDGWNSFAEQYEMVGDDWVMKTILIAQMVVSWFGDLVGHLEYLAKLAGYIAYIAKGAGALLNALTSAAIGWIPPACDAINFVLGLIGTCWASHKMSKATDPQERARYNWLVYKQSEHMITSLVSGIAGAITVYATAGQAPSTLGREVANAAVEGLGGELSKGLMQTVFGLAAPEETPEPVNPMGRLPKDIFGDVAAIGYLFTDEGTPARDKVDRFVMGTVRPAPRENADCAPAPLAQGAEAASPENRPSPPEVVDHAPVQVEVLAVSEANLEAALEAADGNVEAAETRVENATNVVEQVEAAHETAEQMDEGAGEVRSDLDEAVPAGEALVDQAGELASSFADLSSPLGDLEGGAGKAREASTVRPQREGRRSLLDRARDWAAQRAINAVLGACGGVGQSETRASGKRQEAGAEGNAGEAQAQSLVSEESAQVEETRADAAEAAAGEARAEANEAELAQAVQVAEDWQAEAEAEVQQKEDERAQVQRVLEEVRTEKDRQIADNEAFRAEWGPWFEQTVARAGDEQPPLPQERIDGLWQAHDDLADQADDFQSEGQGLLGAAPAAVRPTGQKALTHFATAQAERVAGLAGAIAAAEAMVGEGSQAAWDALAAAERQANGVDDEIVASWSEILPVLLELPEVPVEREEGQGAPPDEPEAPSPPAAPAS